MTKSKNNNLDKKLSSSSIRSEEEINEASSKEPIKILRTHPKSGKGL